ncbi:MAG: hypothetical protein C5B55_03545 [Blastocatellia bacterium]|nr:MAG: hypothetical protein C5B55_03545 [Blastocatellia bacterium]
MKYFGRLIVLVLSLLLGCVFTVAQQHEPPLTNEAIVKLTKAGFKEKTIISIIDARLTNFELSPEKMIELKKNGVTEKVIVAMLARQEGMAADDESWGDDPFFATGSDTKADPNKNSNGDNSTNIFGSSGGVKGHTKSRGTNGSVDSDTQTVGSATVRIIRPPTEAGGGGPAKLEKTKSLTNDSIIELVEAGFSEGTIIRRIEQSPVEFDLSGPKLDELRKRRVSEKILTAMKTAMGSESSK